MWNIQIEMKFETLLFLFSSFIDIRHPRLALKKIPYSGIALLLNYFTE